MTATCSLRPCVIAKQQSGQQQKQQRAVHAVPAFRQAAAGALAALAVLAAPASQAAEVVPDYSLLPLQKLLLQQEVDHVYEYNGKKLFDPMGYSGRWYEVASLKTGFSGEGQQDCHCTQGIYTPKEMAEGIKLEVDTFCVHGSPTGRLSGILGSVSCANPLLLEVLPEFLTPAERQEGIIEKCTLSFDSLPFLPPQPYVIIRTDYTSYALVRGSTDRSFIQIYSRTPNPGAAFIAEKKDVLRELGYPADDIVDTPQDCVEMSPDAMMAAMDAGMRSGKRMPASTPPAEAMRGYDLGPVPISTIPAPNDVLGNNADQRPSKGVTFDSVRNPLESVKNLFRLFGMQ